MQLELSRAHALTKDHALQFEQQSAEHARAIRALEAALAEQREEAERWEQMAGSLDEQLLSRTRDVQALEDETAEAV